ncbi:MAG: hypothetical protein ABL962_10425 [Fimbriimonadaceae bacterium]
MTDPGSFGYFVIAASISIYLMVVDLCGALLGLQPSGIHVACLAMKGKTGRKSHGGTNWRAPGRTQRHVEARQGNGVKACRWSAYPRGG